MPPAAKRNFLVVIVDLKYKDAWKILKEFCAFMVVTEAKHSVQLILMNSERGDNATRIEILPGPMQFHLKNLATLLHDNYVEKNNWYDAIIEAVKVIKKNDDKSIITKKIILITDLLGDPSPPEKSSDVVDKCVKNLNKVGAYLYIVGSDIESDIMIDSDESIKKYMKSFTDGNWTLDVIKMIAEQANVVLADIDTMTDIITSFSKPIPTQAWNHKLSVGTLQLPTVCRRVFKLFHVPVSKARAPPAQNYQIPAADETETPTIVSKQEVLAVYNYLDTYISLPPDVNQSLRWPGDRMFQLVGFIDKKRISNHYIMKRQEAHLVSLADPIDDSVEDAGENLIFRHLVNCMQRHGVYALVRRSYNNRNAPVTFVLIPRGGADASTRNDGKGQPEHCLMVPIAEQLNTFVDVKDAFVDMTPEEIEAEDLEPDAKRFKLDLDFDGVDSCIILDRLEQTTLPIDPLLSMHDNFKITINKLADVLETAEY